MSEYQIYKIVRRNDENELRSIWKYGKFAARYMQGIVTKPAMGKLFAYEALSLIDLDLHTVGATPSYNYEIWECLTTEEPVSFHAMIPRYSQQEIWKEYWFDYPVWKFHVNQGTYTPKGTVLCEDIKLQKRLIN